MTAGSTNVTASIKPFKASRGYNWQQKQEGKGEWIGWVVCVWRGGAGGAETEEQWEGVWPEPRFTFHCENTRPERSSERSDRYSEVCQHCEKCTLVRLLRITHIKHSSRAQKYTQEIAGFLNMPPCFSSSWNNSRPVHLRRSLPSKNAHFSACACWQWEIKAGFKYLMYGNKAQLANPLIYNSLMGCLCIMNREQRGKVGGRGRQQQTHFWLQRPLSTNHRV